MHASSPTAPAARAATQPEVPVTPKTVRKTTRKPGPAANRPTRNGATPGGGAAGGPMRLLEAPPLHPRDLAAYGRRVGAAYRADPRNARRVAALALARGLGLEGYDPADRLGAGYRVFCGIFGEPIDPDRRDPYPLSHLPAEVADFWHDLLPEAASRVQAVLIASDPRFVDAFVAAVTE